MNILGIHVGRHDSAACLFKDQDLVAFCKEERLTRQKNCGRDFDLLSVDEVLGIGGIRRRDLDVVALTRVYLPLRCLHRRGGLKAAVRSLRGKKSQCKLFREMEKTGNFDEESLVNYPALRKYLGVRPDTEIRFINHHLSHVLGAFMYTTWPKDSLFVSIDGGGDFAYYAAYHHDGEDLRLLLGDDIGTFKRHQLEGASIGLAYCSTTELLGFMSNRHEGKVTGLAAFGKPVSGDEIASWFRVKNDFEVVSDLATREDLDRELAKVNACLGREDMAASIQYATEKVALEWIRKLMAGRNVRHIGMSGGVFSNVLLNQKVSELPGVESTFVFPPMGDEGLPVGNCVAVLMDKLGIAQLRRREMRDVYFGRPFGGADLVTAARDSGFPVFEPQDIPAATAGLLSRHFIGGLFVGRMEMGPRALGARTILANPARRNINDSINQRLGRTEFMPFAPYVLDIDAAEVFKIGDHNRYPCRHMTITVNVREKYHDVIPAVVHVDGTARPQIVCRGDNPLYYDILAEFKRQTGIPCLVNTSFNAHEEPIINTPAEALAALRDNRVDFLVCDAGIITQASGSSVALALSEMHPGSDAAARH